MEDPIKMAREDARPRAPTAQEETGLRIIQAAIAERAQNAANIGGRGLLSARAMLAALHYLKEILPPGTLPLEVPGYLTLPGPAASAHSEREVDIVGTWLRLSEYAGRLGLELRLIRNAGFFALAHQDCQGTLHAVWDYESLEAVEESLDYRARMAQQGPQGAQEGPEEAMPSQEETLGPFARAEGLPVLPRRAVGEQRFVRRLGRPESSFRAPDAFARSIVRPGQPGTLLEKAVLYIFAEALNWDQQARVLEQLGWLRQYEAVPPIPGDPAREAQAAPGVKGGGDAPR